MLCNEYRFSWCSIQGQAKALDGPTTRFVDSLSRPNGIVIEHPSLGFGTFKKREKNPNIGTQFQHRPWIYSLEHRDSHIRASRMRVTSNHKLNLSKDFVIKSRVSDTYPILLFHLLQAESLPLLSWNKSPRPCTGQPCPLPAWKSLLSSKNSTP
jgi:hypothetical protein